MPPAPRIAAVWRAMLWKECRETGLIAGLIMLAVGGVLGVMVARESWAVARPNMANSYVTACDAFLDGPYSIMAAMAALIVGFMQFVRESRQDRFGFLVHRPVSRAQLFWSKVAAGIGLYALALLVPLGIAMAWASHPYNIPLPFSWAMGLPALSDVVAGIPLYFAGVLVARRSEARWIGSRLLPVAGPILAAIANFAMPEVAWGLLISVAATLVMIAPAHSAYVTGGQYHPMGRTAKAALGLCTCVAVVIVGGIAIGLVNAFLEEKNVSVPVENISVQFDKAGNPVLLRQPYNTNDEAWSLTDLQSHTLPRPEVSGRRITAGDMIMSTGSLYSRSDFYRYPAHYPQYYFDYATTTYDGTRWYRAMGMGGDYFVGYQLTNRRLVGAIGPDGLEPGARVPRSRFAEPLNTTNAYLRYRSQLDLLIGAGDTLYRVTKETQVEPIFKAPEIIRRLGTLPVTKDTAPGIAIDYIYLVQTDRQLVALSSGPEFKPLFQFPLEHPEQWIIEVGQIPATGRFLVCLRPYIASNPGSQPHVYYLDAQGQVDHEMDLPNMDQRRTQGHPFADYAMIALAPPVLVNAGLPFDTARMERTGYFNDPKIAQEEHAFLYWAMTLSTGVGVLTAIALYFLARQRRFTQTATWLWTVLGLLLGPAAIFTLLSTRGLGVLVRCTHCGKPEPASAEACANCGTLRPTPACNGTEIFSANRPAVA
jgi:hypothetical protein